MAGQNRIGGIDALRAFALLGILLVHTTQLYNFNNSYNDFSYFSKSGTFIQDFIFHYGSGRFATLFSILFGTSFYLILRKPNYSQIKFLWRCIILMCFGLFNKLFYTSDILVWYGLNGIVLSLFPVKKFPPSAILVLSILFLLLSFSIEIDMKDIISSNVSMRYRFSEGVKGVIYYPYFESLKSNMLLYIKYSSTLTLSLFFMGFYLGQIGIFNRLDKFVNLKSIILFTVLGCISWLIFRYSNYSSKVLKIYYIITALLYATVFLYIYHFISNKLSLMRDYGRLGLTNYSLQNIIFPIAIPVIIYPAKLSFEYIILISLTFYAIQMYFSSWWLKYHRFGPLEYIWRILTDRKIIPNKNERQRVYGQIIN